jgi:hypothetical protein
VPFRRIRVLAAQDANAKLFARHITKFRSRADPLLKAVSGITYVSVIPDTEFGFFLEAARPRQAALRRSDGTTLLRGQINPDKAKDLTNFLTVAAEFIGAIRTWIVRNRAYRVRHGYRTLSKHRHRLPRSRRPREVLRRDVGLESRRFLRLG